MVFFHCAKGKKSCYAIWPRNISKNLNVLLAFKTFFFSNVILWGWKHVCFLKLLTFQTERLEQALNSGVCDAYKLKGKITFNGTGACEASLFNSLSISKASHIQVFLEKPVSEKDPCIPWNVLLYFEISWYEA